MYVEWDDVTYEVVEMTAPALLAVTQQLKKARVNGGVILKVYRPIDVTACAAAMRDDLRGFPNILRCFLNAPAVRDSVPELRIPSPLTRLPDFDEYSGFEFEGTVTHHLLCGGAYTTSSVDEEAARQMSRDFVDALVGKGRLHTVVWGTAEPWTPWFNAVAWDQTFVIWQPQTMQWALFCMTDTD